MRPRGIRVRQEPQAQRKGLGYGIASGKQSCRTAKRRTPQESTPKKRRGWPEPSPSKWLTRNSDEESGVELLNRVDDADAERVQAGGCGACGKRRAHNFLERGNTGSDVRCVNVDGARGHARTGSDTRKRDEEVLAAGIEGDLRWGTARRRGEGDDCSAGESREDGRRSWREGVSGDSVGGAVGYDDIVTCRVKGEGYGVARDRVLIDEC